MEKIKKLRKELGVKQHELGLKLGVNKTKYSSIENGKLIPNNLEYLKEQAAKELMPYLIVKINDTRAKLEQLESLMLQFK